MASLHCDGWIRSGMAFRVGVMALALCVLPWQAIAQDAAPEDGDRRRQRWDPERIAEMRAEREAQREQQLKEQLQASDEDFEAIKPLIEQVESLQREQRAVSMQRMMGQRPDRDRGGRRDEAGEGEARPERPEGERNNRSWRGRFGEAEATEMSTQGKALQEAQSALQTAVSDEATDAEALKQKVAAFRAARDAHEQQLTKAKEELRSVLVARQEAVLVLRGVLD